MDVVASVLRCCAAANRVQHLLLHSGCLSFHADNHCTIELQAIGATTPAFVAALSFILLRQRESWGVYAALVPVMVSMQRRLVR